jgi:hypothetical protein
MITAHAMQYAIFNAIDVSSRRLLRFGRERRRLASTPIPSLYAAFVYASIAKTIKDSGWLLGTALHRNEFVFSLGRGNIASTEETFSYITFQVGKNRYELHCGLNVQSNIPEVVIEIDVFVIPLAHGKECRKKSTRVNYKSVKSLLEVKHYRRRVDISKAKEFFGTCKLVCCRGSYAALVSKGEITEDALKLFANSKPKIGAFPNSDVLGAKAMAEEIKLILSKLLK